MIEQKASDQKQELQVGDVVHLNSGSPDLHIVDLGAKFVVVEWSLGNNVPERAAFPYACVHRV